MTLHDFNGFEDLAAIERQVRAVTHVHANSRRYSRVKYSARKKQKTSSTLGVNFTNILRAAFAPIFLLQKITNLNCKH
jgi:hypothetical protein